MHNLTAETAVKSKKKFFTVRRGIVLTLLFIIIGISCAVISIFEGMIITEEATTEVGY